MAHIVDKDVHLASTRKGFEKVCPQCGYKQHAAVRMCRNPQRCDYVFYHVRKNKKTEMRNNSNEAASILDEVLPEINAPSANPTTTHPVKPITTPILRQRIQEGRPIANATPARPQPTPVVQAGPDPAAIREAVEAERKRVITEMLPGGFAYMGTLENPVMNVTLHVAMDARPNMESRFLFNNGNPIMAKDLRALSDQCWAFVHDAVKASS